MHIFTRNRCFEKNEAAIKYAKPVPKMKADEFKLAKFALDPAGFPAHGLEGAEMRFCENDQNLLL